MSFLNIDRQTSRCMCCHAEVNNEKDAKSKHLCFSDVKRTDKETK